MNTILSSAKRKVTTATTATKKGFKRAAIGIKKAATNPHTIEAARQLTIIALGAFIAKKIHSKNMQYTIIKQANDLSKKV